MNATLLNEALRDPSVRTIALDGDHRMLDGLDLDVVREDPNPSSAPAEPRSCTWNCGVSAAWSVTTAKV